MSHQVVFSQSGHFEGPVEFFLMGDGPTARSYLSVWKNKQEKGYKFLSIPIKNELDYTLTIQLTLIVCWRVQ